MISSLESTMAYCTNPRKNTSPRSNRNKDLVSIITVVLNGELSLEKTIKSVINQTYSKIEYIIIDGGSTDGTLNIIRQYQKNIEYFISESDSGIAEAMNKGIRRANGDYLIFLNADDCFYSNNSLEQCIKYFKPKIDILACDIIFGKENSRRSPRGFSFWFNFKFGLCHQGIICRKALFTELGMFDENLKIEMDYDLLMRAYRKKLRLEICPEILSYMSDTGISSKTDWPSLQNRFKEEELVHLKNSCNRGLSLLYTIYHPSYILYRQLKFLAGRFVQSR
jgi:glycosyltransferase involved in cell wall biosynthesis